MHRTFASSRLALTLRRLRGRFGISAPKVAVRTHVPWYWRALAAVVILGFALALAGWVYDAGRRFAGFERSVSEGEISALRETNAELEAEVARLRGIANASESNLQIDRAALDRLTVQVKHLEVENNLLKESLAEVENLAKGTGKAGSVSLGRLRIEPEGVPGRYRYRLLVSRRGDDVRQDFKGVLQFHVTLQPVDGQSVIIVLPRSDDPEAGKFAVSFRSFRSLEGGFQIPADARIKRVEVRLIQDGAVMASQAVSL